MEWFDKIEQALPPIRIEDYRNECDFYGASDEIARSLGLAQTPVPWAVWSHGWTYTPLRFIEGFIWNVAPEREAILVFREDHRRLLQQHGYDSAFAVGAPFLYAVPVPMNRLENSLLIMPLHSLDYTHQQFDEERYFAELDPYLSKFKHVAACIYPADVQKGNCLEALSRRKIPYFVGANCRDRNGLARVRSIMSAFSHMTTNWLGSHLPYAAYSGCNVSIYGPRPKMAREDYRNDPYFVANPHILEWLFELLENGHYEREYAHFFRAPDVVTDDRAWAADQLGEKHKRTPLEMARLFHWTAGLRAGDGGLDFAEWAPALGWTPELEGKAPELLERVGKHERQANANGRRLLNLESSVERLRGAVQKRDRRIKRKSQILCMRAQLINELRAIIATKDEGLGALQVECDLLKERLDAVGEQTNC